MKTIEKQTLYRTLLALCSGLCLAGSFAPDNLPLFAFAALVLMSYLVATARSVKEGAWIGWVFGFGWFVTGVNWVQYSMHHYGALPDALAWGLTGLLAMGLALFPAGAFAVATKLTDSPMLRVLVTIPAAWTAAEWVREWLFSGFPWLNPAYALVDWTIAGWAPLGGVLAVLYASLVVAGLLCVAWMQWGCWINVASALIVCVSILMIGYAGRMMPWTSTIDTVSLYLIQPNFDPIADQESLDRRIKKVTGMLYAVENEKTRYDAVMLPESVFAHAWQQFHAVHKQQLISWVNRNETPLLFNAFWEAEPRVYSNAAFMLMPETRLSIYEKHHLVPFGEFVPEGFHGLIRRMAIPMTDLKAGALTQPLMTLKNHPVSVNLCYENLFAQQWREAWQGEQMPRLLINLSNLKWFGPQKAHWQHWQMSQMRALETSRALVSVTNSGITGVIDAKGRMVQTLPTDQVGHLLVTVPIQSDAMTPFVRFGNTPVVFWVLLLLLVTPLWSRVLKMFKNK